MAKTKKTAKRRTKTAIAARKYERRLKQRVKAGDEDAIGIVERRKEYSRRYEEKRRQGKMAEDEARDREDMDSEIRMSTEDGTERHPTGIDSAVGGLLEGMEEEGRTEASPLFCTPAPPTTLKGVIKDKGSVKVMVHGDGEQSVSEHTQKVLDLGDSGEEDEQTHRLSERKPSVVTAGGAGPRERQTDGRGRLVRRYVGGMLAEDPSAAPLLRRPKLAPPPEDTTDSLIAQLKKNRIEQKSLRAKQKELRVGEVEILVKLNSRDHQPYYEYLWKETAVPQDVSALAAC